MEVSSAPQPAAAAGDGAGPILEASGVSKVFGGLGSIWGVVLGAMILSFINNHLIPNVLNRKPQEWFDLDFELAQLSFGIFGFLLVIMMVLRPEGLLPERRRQMELREDAHTDEVVESVRA